MARGLYRDKRVKRRPFVGPWARRTAAPVKCVTGTGACASECPVSRGGARLRCTSSRVGGAPSSRVVL